MEELSIEEKAKRYDEAIERSKNYYSTTDSAADIKLIGLIFPELAESEDERIRKMVLKAFKLFAEKQDWVGHCLDDIDWDKCTAWLEKQSDYQSIKVPKWSEEDSNVWNRTLLYLENMKDSCATSCVPYINECIIWLKSLRPQSQWKPSDAQMRVLDLAIRCGINRGTTEETTLVSLFNDLKKLRGDSYESI